MLLCSFIQILSFIDLLNFIQILQQVFKLKCPGYKFCHLENFWILLDFGMYIFLLHMPYFLYKFAL